MLSSISKDSLVLHDGLNQPVHPLLGYFVPTKLDL